LTPRTGKTPVQSSTFAIYRSPSLISCAPDVHLLTGSHLFFTLSQSTSKVFLKQNQKQIYVASTLDCSKRRRNGIFFHISRLISPRNKASTEKAQSVVPQRTVVFSVVVVYYSSVFRIQLWPSQYSVRINSLLRRIQFDRSIGCQDALQRACRFIFRSGTAQQRVTTQAPRHSRGKLHEIFPAQHASFGEFIWIGELSRPRST
jgi:hypothetical protein